MLSYVYNSIIPEFKPFQVIKVPLVRVLSTFVVCFYNLSSPPTASALELKKKSHR